MRTLLVFLGILDPQPAIAETPDPQREIVVDWIEVNRLENGYQKLDQVIFWRIRYDRHTRTYETVDCGWKHWHDVALIKIDHGWAVICEQDNTVWMSERIYWSHTDFDPELVYRESRFW